MKRLPSLLTKIVVTLVTLTCGIWAFCGEIHDAARTGDVDKVEALLKANPDLVSSKDDKFGATPLYFAAKKGQEKVAVLLLSNKAEVDAKSIARETPLFVAAEFGHTNMVVLLMAHGADVNTTNRVGDTPLHAAALAGHKDVVELLLAKKADVNPRDTDNFTPLHFAAFNRFNDVVKLLRQHGGHE